MNIATPPPTPLFLQYDVEVSETPEVEGKSCTVRAERPTAVSKMTRGDDSVESCGYAIQLSKSGGRSEEPEGARPATPYITD